MNTNEQWMQNIMALAHHVMQSHAAQQAQEAAEEGAKHVADIGKAALKMVKEQSKGKVEPQLKAGSVEAAADPMMIPSLMHATTSADQYPNYRPDVLRALAMAGADVSSLQNQRPGTREEALRGAGAEAPEPQTLLEHAARIAPGAAAVPALETAAGVPEMPSAAAALLKQMYGAGSRELDRLPLLFAKGASHEVSPSAIRDLVLGSGAAGVGGGGFAAALVPIAAHEAALAGPEDRAAHKLDQLHDEMPQLSRALSEPDNAPIHAEQSLMLRPKAFPAELHPDQPAIAGDEDYQPHAVEDDRPSAIRDPVQLNLADHPDDPRLHVEPLDASDPDNQFASGGMVDSALALARRFTAGANDRDAIARLIDALSSKSEPEIELGPGVKPNSKRYANHYLRDFAKQAPIYAGENRLMDHYGAIRRDLPPPGVLANERADGGMVTKAMKLAQETRDFQRDPHLTNSAARLLQNMGYPEFSDWSVSPAEETSQTPSAARSAPMDGDVGITDALNRAELARIMGQEQPSSPQEDYGPELAKGGMVKRALKLAKGGDVDDAGGDSVHPLDEGWEDKWVGKWKPHEYPNLSPQESTVAGMLRAGMTHAEVGARHGMTNQDVSVRKARASAKARKNGEDLGLPQVRIGRPQAEHTKRALELARSGISPAQLQERLPISRQVALVQLTRLRNKQREAGEEPLRYFKPGPAQYASGGDVEWGAKPFEDQEGHFTPQQRKALEMWQNRPQSLSPHQVMDSIADELDVSPTHLSVLWNGARKRVVERGLDNVETPPRLGRRPHQQHIKAMELAATKNDNGAPLSSADIADRMRGSGFDTTSVGSVDAMLSKARARGEDAPWRKRSRVG